ncbi:MAG: MBL fold metallo-hydrolase [Clostridiales bacterium]|nr:MBL fold metallo-hydrolase [Clostridiales bacterium]
MEVIQYTIGMSNGFFIRDGKTVIAVDSGGEPGEKVFLDECARSLIDPQEIKLLVVTHGHVDHFINMNCMKSLTGAPLLCHKNAVPFLRDGLSPIGKARSELGREIMRRQEIDGPPISVVPRVAPDIEFEGTYDLKQWGVNGEIIQTPGHSKCSTAIILDSGEAIVGDTIVQPTGAAGVSLAFLSDEENNDTSLFESVETILACAHTIYSGHGGPFSREDVQRALYEEKSLRSIGQQ